MRTFEIFIESEAFFPVLILLLVLLVCVFMWIILSNKNENQKRRDKKKIKIDENAEIKIVSDGNEEVRVKKEKREEIKEEPERTEIAIIEEVKNTDLGFNYEELEKTETVYDIDIPDFSGDKFSSLKSDETDETIDYKNIDYGDLSVPPVPDIFKDENINAKEEESILSEHSYDKAESSDISAEVESDKVSQAFNSVPNSDTSIHEDFKFEPPKEYVGEKTEIFDFPDFNQDDIFSSGNIENEIISAAEDYIKNIMSK